MYSSITS